VDAVNFKGFVFIMKFKINIVDGNFPFQLETVKSENSEKHLIFFNGSHYHNVDVKELEDLICFAKNTIDNFDNVNNYIDKENERIVERMTNFRTEHKKPKKVNSGFIYIAKCNSTNFYKIGQAKSTEIRIKQLKTANANIELFKSYSVVDVLIEKELHLHFIDKKVNREWFDLNQKDLKYIDEFLTK